MRIFYKALLSPALVLLSACVTGQDQLPPESPSPAAAAPQPASATEPAAPVAEASAPPKTCAGQAGPAADGAIEDFEDGNNQIAELSGRNGYWFTAKDDKGSTIEPSGDFRPADGGAGSAKAANVKGNTVSVDGAWGATFGFNFLQNGFYDLSKYAGVSFKIKAAKPGTVRVKLPDVNTVPEGGVCSSGCWNAFGKEVTAETEWREVTVFFSELKQQDGWGDPRPPALAVTKVKGLEWSIDRGQEFDVWIDDVQFVDCK